MNKVKSYDWLKPANNDTFMTDIDETFDSVEKNEDKSILKGNLSNLNINYL